MLIVHHNHLKPCASPKRNKRSNAYYASVNDLEQNEQHQPTASQHVNEPLIGIRILTLNLTGADRQETDIPQTDMAMPFSTTII